MRDEFRISFLPIWRQKMEWFCAVTWGPMFLLMLILMISAVIIGIAFKPLALSLLMAGMFDLVYFFVALLFSSNYRSDMIFTGKEFRPSVHGVDLLNPFRKEIILEISSIERVYHMEKVGLFFCFKDGKNHFEGLPHKKGRDWSIKTDEMRDFIIRFNKNVDFIRVDLKDITGHTRSLNDFYWSRIN